ncbi:MAG: aminoacetone oxidase family FAD-binding enzyme [Candidatus Omnitrophica bacterium]|nr:aminoacetone oxidase family FAD-binding enzyme [Candidatus Omnitrophota bacterium]
MQKFKTVVIGGGAAGIVAAISAKRKGESVAICDRMARIGKKILASGNGRCNLLNEKLDESFYNPPARGLVRSIFEKFGKEDALSFFKELGLETYSEDGRIFPRTNQSSSVLKVLEMELNRLSVSIELNYEVNRVSYSQGLFTVTSKGGKTIECEKLIVAGGGKSYPALGSDGSCYKLAANMGHKIIEPVPAAVPIVLKDRLCHLLQGQKITARVKAIINQKTACESFGDLLLTNYGLSGTAILDVSEEISVAINRQKTSDVLISIDMVPFMDRAALRSEISKRIKNNWKPEDLLTGILPNKFYFVFESKDLSIDAEKIVNSVKGRLFKVVETKRWNEADFTSGGIDTKYVKEGTLESTVVKGLYFAGEILDVCGKRGGYNLAWAWASGYVAGSAR